MTKTTIIILLLISIISCKKENNQDADNVIFHDILPDTNLRSIDSLAVVSNGLWCIDDEIPYPSENKVTYELDIDSDNVIDFKVSVRHLPITCNYPKCGDYDYYSCILDIVGNNSGDSIIVLKNQNYYEHVLFKVNDTIKYENSSGVSEWSTLISGGCPPAFGDDLRNCYIGVKKNECLGWIHIDKITNGIVIMDYAINLTKGNSIIIGE